MLPSLSSENSTPARLSNSGPDTDISTAILRQNQPLARKYHPLDAIVALLTKHQNISSFIASNIILHGDNYGLLSTPYHLIWRCFFIQQLELGRLWIS